MSKKSAVLFESVPSEVAGIKVERENKWITLIQNASRSGKPLGSRRDMNNEDTE